MRSLLVVAILSFGCSKKEQPHPSAADCRDALDTETELLVKQQKYGPDQEAQERADRATWAKDDARILRECEKSWSIKHASCVKTAKDYEQARTCRD